MKIITAEWLVENGACESASAHFREFWPDGMVVNEKNVLKGLQQGLQMEWFGKFAAKPAENIYLEAKQAAENIYQEATNLVWKVYQEAAKPAWKAYQKAIAPAENIYLEAIAPHLTTLIRSIK